MPPKNTHSSDFKPAGSNSEAIEKVGHLVDELCAQSRTLQVCMHCGSALHQVDATLSLWGDDRSWNVSLPVCPKCDLTLEMVNTVSRHVA